MSKGEPIRFWWQGKPSNELSRDELLTLVETLQRECVRRLEEARQDLDAMSGTEQPS